jgi:predicted nuclease of restriction endonuclease-like RecB superfamily
MLPAQLLRIKTRQGTIFPLFCEDNKEHLLLAEQLISQFNESVKKNEKKKLLEKRIATVESQWDDYKLVRGLSTLLERRCQFSISQSGGDGSNVDPMTIRKALFEESSRMHLALTESDRNRVLDRIAARLNLSTSYINQIMWNDLEENMIHVGFNSIKQAELLGIYNLSIMQTLLFNCTKLEFSVSGGMNWKRVLRDIKRLGLMYNLQQSEVSEPDNSNADGSALLCSLDGPISLFKLTDRYGTSIAKLLPSIIMSKRWSMSAWIVRKTISGRKIYEFKMSFSEAPSLLLLPSTSKARTAPLFDSSVEEKFANRFKQSANGWKLIREPDPLIVSNGTAFIPDFMFQKYDKKVYLEIVGFWTKDYLQRKIQKLKDIVSNKKIDLFVAVNEELACSKSIIYSGSSSQDRIISYKNDSVPIKSLLNYLKSIDQELTEKYASDPNLKIIFDGAQDIISIEQIALQYKIPIDSAITIASRDNDRDYVKAGPYFISKSKTNELIELLAGTTKFMDACAIFSEELIPEPCYGELISKLGYDVVWQSMDSNNASIVKRS